MRSLQNDALVLRMLTEKKRHLFNNKNLKGNPWISFCEQVNIAKSNLRCLSTTNPCIKIV